MSQLLSKTICLSVTKAWILSAKVKKGMNKINGREFNVTNEKASNIIRRNVPTSSGEKIRGVLLYLKNDELDKDNESEKGTNVVAFTARVRSKSTMKNDAKSSDEDLFGVDLTESYKLLYLKWK